MRRNVYRIMDARTDRMARNLYRRYSDGIVGSILEKARGLLEKAEGIIKSATSKIKGNDPDASKVSQALRCIVAARVALGARGLAVAGGATTVAAAHATAAATAAAVGLALRKLKTAVVLLVGLAASPTGMLVGGVIATIKLVTKLLEKIKSVKEDDVM